MQDPDFRREFLGGAGSGKTAVEGFIAQNKESALKTKPKVRSIDLAERYFIRVPLSLREIRGCC